GTSGVRPCADPPAGYCMQPTAELVKAEREPISMSGASIFSMSPNQAIPAENQSIFRHGSNAGHSSGVAQGQRSLNRCSGRDFQHEVFAPTATAAFHSQTVAAGMLLQQRPTRRVLSGATAKLLRDEAESMVPNIDPEQVRKLAGWGLTQNDRASFVGWSQSLISLGPVPHQPGFLINSPYRRLAIRNSVERGHGTRSKCCYMNDL